MCFAGSSCTRGSATQPCLWEQLLAGQYLVVALFVGGMYVDVPSGIGTGVFDRSAVVSFVVDRCVRAAVHSHHRVARGAQAGEARSWPEHLQLGSVLLGTNAACFAHRDALCLGVAPVLDPYCSLRRGSSCLRLYAAPRWLHCACPAIKTGCEMAFPAGQLVSKCRTHFM